MSRFQGTPATIEITDEYGLIESLNAFMLAKHFNDISGLPDDQKDDTNVVFAQSEFEMQYMDALEAYGFTSTLANVDDADKTRPLIDMIIPSIWKRDARVTDDMKRHSVEYAQVARDILETIEKLELPSKPTDLNDTKPVINHDEAGTTTVDPGLIGLLLETIKAELEAEINLSDTMLETLEELYSTATDLNDWADDLGYELKELPRLVEQVSILRNTILEDIKANHHGNGIKSNGYYLALTRMVNIAFKNLQTALPELTKGDA